MVEGTITTRFPAQEGLLQLTGLGAEHGVYCASVKDSERTDMATFRPWFNRDDIIEFKSVPSRDLRPRIGVTGYAIPVSPPEGDLHALSGIQVYSPGVPHTLTPDIFISYYSRNTNSVFETLKAALARTNVTVAFAGHPREQLTYLESEHSRQTWEMEENLRRMSELPENWDAMGGPVISLNAIAETRDILSAAIGLNLPTPWVAPGGDAGIGIQWDTTRVELYIDIVPGEETTYVLTPKAGNSDAEDGVLNKANLLRVLIQLAEPSI